MNFSLSVANCGLPSLSLSHPFPLFLFTSLSPHPPQASDIRDVPLHHFGLLLLPVYQYLAVLHGLGPSITEVAAGKPVEGTAQELMSKLPLVVVRPKTSFCR